MPTETAGPSCFSEYVDWPGLVAGQGAQEFDLTALEEGRRRKSMRRVASLILAGSTGVVLAGGFADYGVVSGAWSIDGVAIIISGLVLVGMVAASLPSRLRKGPVRVRVDARGVETLCDDGQKLSMTWSDPRLRIVVRGKLSMPDSPVARYSWTLVGTGLARELPLTEPLFQELIDRARAEGAIVQELPIDQRQRRPGWVLYSIKGWTKGATIPNTTSLSLE
jgi:hypothetical protein